MDPSGGGGMSAPRAQQGEAAEPDRRNQILDAALEEFAAHGFRGATIKRIAQRARLRSQALIYWYFPAKEALFEAVLGQQLPIVQMVPDSAPLLDLAPEEGLPRLASPPPFPPPRPAPPPPLPSPPPDPL